MARRSLAIVAAAVVSANALFLLVLWAKMRTIHVVPQPASQPSPAITFRVPVDHPVTPGMVAAARALGGAKAPDFAAEDTTGQRYTLASLTSKHPTLLYFIEYQCPCCKSAKPYIDRIQNYYGDVCNVVGIIDAKPDVAQAWVDVAVPQFRVLLDPKLEVIKRYKATRGTYSVLIAPGGRIVKEFPGYCQNMLKTTGADIAKLACIPPRDMPIAPAPKRMTSGCAFPGIELPGDEL